MSARTLLKDGCVLTLGSHTPNFNRADVLIDGGRIAEISPHLRARDAQQVDATDTIVMPGFVDAHRHSWRTLFRNLDGMAGGEGLRAASFTPSDVYAASLVGLMGALETGISTVVDWLDPQATPENLDAALEAHRDSGARTVAVISSAFAPETIRNVVGSGTNRTTIAFGAESSAGWDVARESGWRIHHHVTADGAGAVSALGREGLLGPDVTLIHCTNADDSDIGAIAGAGSTVVLTPASEMAGGMGSPPIQRLIDNGIRPGLGVGSEATAPGDMFAQMRATNSLQHAAMFDLKLSGKSGLPQLLTTRDVIKYATVDSAAAIGMASSIGSLEPGKQADIVVLRTDLPNIHPVNDPIGAVVWGMDTSNVSWVFVGGEPLVREGALVAGHTRARDLAVTSQRRLVAELSGAGEAT
ncbi:MAG: amidohydrolase family protein [Acidimicrobiia bacterium]|nr:amidohydrolase family protein [Acidimicrobiia bacterium]MDH3462806.1 amidohydrolase family protein [Acidimicrobiia bacterium]